MNMSYCRFENTLRDMQDCYWALNEFDDLSASEREARSRMLKLCQEMLNEAMDEPEEVDEQEEHDAKIASLQDLKLQ
jgi:hypothetical protein